MALDRMRAQIDRVSSRPMFEDPMLLFSAEAQSLDNASGRLERALPLRLERTRNRLDMARVALIQKGSALLAPFDRLVGVSAARLEDLSPLSILGRGYAIARDGEGSLVKSVNQVKSGDALSVAVSDGNIDCRVE
jgi:exodeoxyribonuclease VII large subunit